MERQGDCRGDGRHVEFQAAGEGGLTVRARLDTGLYPTGVKVSDQQMAALPITRHDFHGDWNYCLHPDTVQGRKPPPDGTAPRWPTPR